MGRLSGIRRVGALVVSLLFTLLFVGCGAGSTSEMSQPQAPQDGTAGGGGAPFPQESAAPGDGSDRLIIRNKTLRLEVRNTADAVAKVQELAKQHSAIITGMQVATDDGYVWRENADNAALRGFVTVRVPADDYEKFIDDVSGLGVVRYQAEDTSDVTQEHVDLSARLENLRAEEKRLREFFDAAKDVKDMLAIETELGRVRGEIESLDAQVKYLERQAAMATVTVELVEPSPVVVGGWGFGEAFANGIRGAVGVVNLVVTMLIASSPLWIAALILFFPIRALVRRRKARSAPSTPTAEPPGPAAG